MKRNTRTGSQHFLRSPAIAEALFKKTALRSTDTVYDIGAGSGVITAVLAQHVNQVVAIEPDVRTAAILKQNIHQKHGFTNVTILEQDFLQLPLPAGSYSVFANIPFHISAPIVKRFFNSEQSPQHAYLIVQKQFGQKLVSSESKRFTSQLGMLIGAEYAVKVLQNLHKSDFKPQPGVDTVFIELKKRKAPLVAAELLDEYRAFTEACFADPKALARQSLHLIGMQPGEPPSRLTLSQWLLLFENRTTSVY